MAVSLTEVVKSLNQDDVAIVRGGIIPGQGIASLIKEQLSNNSSVRGGKGSSFGALETKTNSEKNQSNNDFDSFRGVNQSYWSNPLSFKSRLEEIKKMSEEARKNGITTSQQQLMIQQPATLFARSSDYKVALMSGMFQLMQVQTRWLMSLAKSMGVDNRLMMQPSPDPKRSFLGKIFSDISQNIKKIPGVEEASTFSKHLMNVLSVLNPMTFGSKTFNATKAVGESFQKVVLGKKGYEYAKDPTAAYKDAGLKLTDSNKLVNLTKVLANIGIKQLDILQDIRRVNRGMADMMGVNVKYNKSNVMFDEYSGDLKTREQFQIERANRKQALSATIQSAHAGGIYGKVMPLVSPFFRAYKEYDSRKNPEKANNLDKIFIQNLFADEAFQHSKDPRVKEIINKMGRSYDFFDNSNQNDMNILKTVANEMYKGKNLSPKEHAIYKKIYERDKKESQFFYNNQLNSRLTYNTANIATNLSGKHIASTKEASHIFENTERFGGNRQMAKIAIGDTGKNIVEEGYKTAIGSKLLRAIPVFGALAGFAQQRKIAKTENEYDLSLRSMSQHPTDAFDDEFNSEFLGSKKGRKTLTAQKQYFKDKNHFKSEERKARQEDITLGIMNSVKKIMELKKVALPVIAIDQDSDNRQTSKELFMKSRRESPSTKRINKPKQIKISQTIPKKSKEEEKSSSWISDLFSGPFGKGLIGGLVGTFLFPTIAKAGDAILDYLKENKGVIGQFITNTLKSAWDWAKENPEITMAGIGTLLLPKILSGTMSGLGNIIIGLGSKVLSNPMLALGAVAIGGLVYNLTESYATAKANGGGFGDVIKEMLIGGKGGFANALGKAGTYAIAGATAGSVIPGIGTIAGFIGGAAVGAIIGGLGSDGIDKYIRNSADIVCNMIGWKPGSTEYKLAQVGNFAPYVGPLLFGLIGKIVPKGILDVILPTQNAKTDKIKEDEAVAKKEGRIYRTQNPFGSENLVLTKEEKEQYDSLKTDAERHKFMDPIIARERTRRSEAQYNDQDRAAAQKFRENLANDAFSGGDFETPTLARSHTSSTTMPLVAPPTSIPQPSPSATSTTQPTLARSHTPTVPITTTSQNNTPQISTATQLANTSPQTNSSSSSSGGGIGSWIENAISNTIINTFRTGQNIIGGISSAYNNAFNGGRADVSGIEMDDLGALSSRFESGNDSSVVAYDSTGGTSYGKYQFSAKEGSMREFLVWVKAKGQAGQQIHDTMLTACNGDWKNLDTGSKTGAPVNAWKQLVASGAVGSYELEFAKEKMFAVALNKINPEATRLIKDNKVLQQVLFSTTMGHGPHGAASIFNDTYKSGMTPSDYVSAIYDLRSTKYGRSTENIRRSVQARYVKEKQLALALLTAGYTNGNSAKGAWKNYPNITPSDLENWKVASSDQLVWPSSSNTITSPMGPRVSTNGSSSMHMGVDMRASAGSPVMSAMGGVVEKIDPQQNGAVIVRHPNGWASRYLHLSKIGVNAGDTVVAGQELGSAGGRGEGKPNRWQPHLHFEMMKGNERVDPEGVFNQYQKNGGKTAYNQHTYASDISQSRQLEAKLSGNYKLSGTTGDTYASGSSLTPIDKNAGGDSFGDIQMGKIKTNFSQYIKEQLDKSPMNFNEEVIKELKKIKAANIAAAKQATQKQNVTIVSPQQGSTPNGGGATLSVGDDTIDRSIDKLFNALGNVLSNYGISHGNLSITTA